MYTTIRIYSTYIYVMYNPAFDEPSNRTYKTQSIVPSSKNGPPTSVARQPRTMGIKEGPDGREEMPEKLN